MRGIEAILPDLPIQNNKPVAKMSFRKEKSCTPEQEKKFDAYLEKLANRNPSAPASRKALDRWKTAKDEKEQLPADKISLMGEDLLLLFYLLGITAENKDAFPETVLDEPDKAADYGAREILEITLSVEGRPYSIPDELPGSLLAKIKKLNMILKEYRGERNYPLDGPERAEYNKGFYSKISRLMTELSGKIPTVTELEKVLESTGGFKDLSARLARLEIYLQNLLNEKDPTSSINLKGANEYDFNLAEIKPDTDHAPGGKEDLPAAAGKRTAIENTNGKSSNVLSAGPGVAAGLTNEVEEINAEKGWGEISSHKESYSTDNKSQAEHGIDSKPENKAELKANDIKGQEFTGIEQKTIQERIQSTDSSRDTYQLNQRDIYSQIDKHIQSVLRTGQNRIEIQLEPETLGKLYLKLELENGKLSVHFSVDNHLVKEQLEQNLVLLRENFLKLGYNVDHIQVETKEQETAFQQGQYQHSNPEQQGNFMNGQQQKSQYDGLSPGELYELFQEEEKAFDADTDNTIWRWYQYKYGYLSINMNYLA